MLDLFFLILFSVFYLIFIFVSLIKDKYIFPTLLILVIFFYEFLFINIAPLLSKNAFYIIKSWQEYLFAAIMLFIIIKAAIEHKIRYSLIDKKIFYILILLTVSGFATVFFQSIVFFEAFLGWRTYILPIFLNFLLYYSNSLYNTSLKAINYTIIFISCLMIVYAIFLDIDFNGDLTILFFYDFINEINPIEDGRFNYVRDDKLRATGFFVSPLIYSSFLGYTFLILMYYFVFSKFKKRILYLLLSAFVFYGLYIARTRIGLVNVGVGFLSTLLIYFNPRVKLGKVIFIPIILTILTFIGLVTGFTSDPSALGRLVQYVSVADNFKFLGLGFGDPLTKVSFDSWYISSLLLFGILFPIYIYLHYLLLKKIHPYAAYYKSNLVTVHEKVFFFANYGFFMSFIYMFAFQYTLGSATIYFFYVMLFLIMSKNRYFTYLDIHN